MESKWGGISEDAFFRADLFDRNRILQKPELDNSLKVSKGTWYLLSVDVGRAGCDTVICVFKVIPQGSTQNIINLVNIVTMRDAHFEEQAIKIKSLFYRYKARTVVIDANGIGMGLIDYMVKSQTDPLTGDYYPDFGVENDEKNIYKKYRTDETEFDAMCLIKANAAFNTEAHTAVQSKIASGKIKFLIDERTAQTKLLGTKIGAEMSSEQRDEYLRPYTLTSILKEEMGNLKQKNDGINIILSQINRSIGKDKFSSFEYGVHYIKQLEDSKKNKKKKFKISDYILMN